MYYAGIRFNEKPLIMQFSENYFKLEKPFDFSSKGFSNLSLKPV